MKQNLGKPNCIQLFPNSSRVPDSPGCLTRHCEFNLTLHTREFNLSHMPNPLETNRNKIKVVRMFDSACANVVKSLTELYYLWYVLATLVCCLLQLLLVYYVCLHKNRK